MLAVSGTAAAAQNDIDFKTATVDHVSIQVADLQRSIDFYQKTFDSPVMSYDPNLGITHLAHNKMLVSLSISKVEPGLWITSRSGYLVSPKKPLSAI